MSNRHPADASGCIMDVSTVVPTNSDVAICANICHCVQAILILSGKPEVVICPTAVILNLHYPVLVAILNAKGLDGPKWYFGAPTRLEQAAA
jgi:hypothetical protein